MTSRARARARGLSVLLAGLLLGCSIPVVHEYPKRAVAASELVGTWRVEFRNAGPDAQAEGEGTLRLEPDGQFEYHARLDPPYTSGTWRGHWRVGERQGHAAVVLQGLRYWPDSSGDAALEARVDWLGIEGSGKQRSDGLDLYLADPDEDRMLTFVRRRP